MAKYRIVGVDNTRMRRPPGACSVMRVTRVETSSLNPFTGETGPSKAHWETGPCYTPVFGKRQEKPVCASCKSGWQTADNYPAEILED